MRPSSSSHLEPHVLNLFLDQISLVLLCVLLFSRGSFLGADLLGMLQLLQEVIMFVQLILLIGLFLACRYAELIEFGDGITYFLLLRCQGIELIL